MGKPPAHYALPVAHGLSDMAFGAAAVEAPVVVELGDEVLSRYAGSWELETGGRVRSLARAGTLVLSAGDADAAALLHPVEPGRTERRARLMREFRAAFHDAAAGDFGAAHALLDPFVPARAFAEMQARRLDDVRAELGALEDVRCVPGRNRFGEIAIIVVLECERGERMIEYSFGEREVGSIRFLRELPNRVVRPESRERFAAFDLETGRSYRVRFVLDDGGGPIALVLVDEAGREHEAARTD